MGKITEISKKLQLEKGMVHRILKTLENNGLAAQDPVTRKYYLGPLIQSLADNPLMVHQILIQIARAEMEKLKNICEKFNIDYSYADLKTALNKNAD